MHPVMAGTAGREPSSLVKIVPLEPPLNVVNVYGRIPAAVDVKFTVRVGP